MRWLIITCILLFALAPFQAHAQQQRDRDRYVVDFSPDMTVASLAVELDVAGGRIFMNPFGADDRPRGWATFVRSLEARGRDGRALTLTPQADASWLVDAEEGERISLRYDVDLAFTREPWSAGNEQAGQFTGEALYLVARPLIVMAEPDGSAEIEFRGDANWRVSAPWTPVSGNARRFVAASRTELVQNSFVIGRHPEIRASQGAFSVILALPGSSPDVGSHVAPVLNAALADYLEMFPETPPRNFLMTFFRAPQEDGEAFSGSAAFSVSGPIPESDPLIWGNFIAHETMHYWNGQSIRSAERARTQWFSEGFTEYLANAALARGDVISGERWIRKAESHLSMYLLFRNAPVWSGVTLSVAGQNKSANRPGVYNGGWVVAMCLDGEIRVRTRDRRSLRDLMRLMYQRFGLTGVAYRADDLYQAASEMADADMSAFFARYVDGDETLPVQECLSRFGLSATLKPYAGEAYIERDRRAPRNSTQRLRSLLS